MDSPDPLNNKSLIVGPVREVLSVWITLENIFSIMDNSCLIICWEHHYRKVTAMKLEENDKRCWFLFQSLSAECGLNTACVKIFKKSPGLLCWCLSDINKPTISTEEYLDTGKCITHLENWNIFASIMNIYQLSRWSSKSLDICNYRTLGLLYHQHWDGGSGFDRAGQFVPQHLRGPDVTLFRGQSVSQSCNTIHVKMYFYSSIILLFHSSCLLSLIPFIENWYWVWKVFSLLKNIQCKSQYYWFSIISMNYVLYLKDVSWYEYLTIVMNLWVTGKIMLGLRYWLK